MSGHDGGRAEVSGPVSEAADPEGAGRPIALHRYVPDLGEPGWKDAFALLGTLAPLMMLAASLAYVDVFFNSPTGGGGWMREYTTAPIWGAYALPAIAVLLGLRRTAALLALGAGSLLVTSPLWSDYWWTGSGGMGPLIVLAALASVALLVSDGPRRARVLMGRPVLASAVVLALTAFTAPPLIAQPTPLMAEVDSVPLVACVILLPVFLLRTAHGRRTAVLLLIAASPIAVPFSGLPVYSMPGRAVLSLVVAPALALLLLLLARALVHRTPPSIASDVQG